MINYNIEEKEKYEIDIDSVSEDKNCVTAFIHFPNQWEYSFYISTMPHTLCYSGDLGDFVFRGNISAKQPLTFFNHNNPNYDYWCEKLQIKNGYEFDGDRFFRSILENVISYFEITEDEYSEEDLENEDIDKLQEILEKNEGKDVAYKFYTLMDFDFEEYNLTRICDAYYDLLQDYPSTYEYMSITSQFKLCCDNLAYLSNKILEKIGYKLEDN